VHCLIEGDGEDLRLQRMRRALNDKCPKLSAWAGESGISVLVREANDIQLSNASVAFDAFRAAIAVEVLFTGDSKRWSERSKIWKEGVKAASPRSARTTTCEPRKRQQHRSRLSLRGAAQPPVFPRVSP
jgi:hypothetical protein